MSIATEPRDMAHAAISAVRGLQLKIEELEKRLKERTPVGLVGVFPGDTWYFPPNRGCRSGGIAVVERVCEKNNHVTFVDGGWNPLDHMLRGEWHLLGRVYNKGMEDEVKL